MALILLENLANNVAGSISNEIILLLLWIFFIVRMLGICGFLPSKTGRFKKQIEDELEMSAQILFMKKKNLLRLLIGEKFENQF